MMDPLPIPSKPCPTRPRRRAGGLLHRGCVGLRFWRYQCSPWWVLIRVGIQWPSASGPTQAHLRVQYWRAIARINFVEVYGLLNDWLW